MGRVLIATNVVELQQPERRHFLEGALTIGRVEGNDVQLPRSNVSKRHARIVEREGRVFIVDLKSTNGTFVNSVAIQAPTVVGDDDRVRIGDWELRLEEPFYKAEPREQEFLDAIEKNPNDDDLRQVYGDWLEEQGRMAEAELLAVELEIRALGPIGSSGGGDVHRRGGVDAADVHFNKLTERHRLLAMSLPLGWRRLVARPAIEGCNVKFELKCPKSWASLEATDDPSVRACSVCKSNVYFSQSIAEARRRATNGQCVAIDATVKRSLGDLEEQVLVLGRMA